jgi:hypothetical protein
MSYAVNLLPESCHNACRRTLRRNAWTVTLLSVGLLLIGTWVALGATNRTIRRLNHEFANVQIRQSELDRQLTLAIKLRNALAQRARTLAALRQEQPLPEQLLVLTRQAPRGVVFTEILTRPVGSARTSSRSPSRAFPGPPSRASRPEPLKATPNDLPPSGGPLVVQMSGYAVDQDELTRLIDILQRVPQWERVELLRAAREPYRTGVALAFQLECRPAEIRQ